MSSNNSNVILPRKLDINECMRERMKKLKDQISTFCIKIYSEKPVFSINVSKEMIKIIGNFLGEMAVLSEVISEKDVKNIWVGTELKSLNDIMKNFVFQIGICCDDSKHMFMQPPTGEKRCYSQYGFTENFYIEPTLKKKLGGHILDGDYYTEADSILMNAVDAAFTDSLEKLLVNGIVKDVRGRHSRGTIASMKSFQAFLRRYYNVVYRGTSNPWNKDTFDADYYWGFLKGYKETSSLDEETCRVLSDTIKSFGILYNEFKKNYDNTQSNANHFTK